ncbi:MAG TPA: L,D-transpeptidase family protein, partial [Candidatus Nanopelagicales bacterium]|nr:L,D-transpeptidase family protein [Candidatus Nanopelagicales bacterium]
STSGPPQRAADPPAIDRPVAPQSTAHVAAHVAARPSAPGLPAARRYNGRLPAKTRQLVVVTAPGWRSTHATVRTYRRSAHGAWRLRSREPARLGYGGLVRAGDRRQGTGTTPAGRFPITESFGRKHDPGTALPYVRVGPDHWWVQDRRSRYYNQLRRGAQGGFARTSSGYNGSERLRSFGRQYDYVAVIDFNRPSPVIGRGSGIFLHVTNGRPTAGCVAIALPAMRSTLTWLDPAEHPRIVIGPRHWLRRHR